MAQTAPAQSPPSSAPKRPKGKLRASLPALLTTHCSAARLKQGYRYSQELELLPVHVSRCARQPDF
ncbi:uncharacterized protein MYCFIDRAFT_182945 [Pseudocercospora fijiensis CIRAD86]|uniref:Uncharacterized protein n=1 Tax=Pseudocercospora fijiensis (strain CIRAD86) TaxID=383855 RepID=M2ZS05_PSEFD|nr:uncharacterized protein MYCFIDRAFT_182945 [Pseudocercospora fijiensis CIRAD86]EME81819.1 hypothetical protein MYCFIDRAFT_182945 [Pseudocercospora fijiensis CIRAD86]